MHPSPHKKTTDTVMIFSLSLRIKCKQITGPRRPTNQLHNCEPRFVSIFPSLKTIGAGGGRNFPGILGTWERGRIVGGAFVYRCCDEGGVAFSPSTSLHSLMIGQGRIPSQNRFFLSFQEMDMCFWQFEMHLVALQFIVFHLSKLDFRRPLTRYIIEKKPLFKRIKILPAPPPPSIVFFPRSREKKFPNSERNRGVGFPFSLLFRKLGKHFTVADTLSLVGRRQSKFLGRSELISLPLFPAVLCNNSLFRKPRSEKSFGTIGLQLMDRVSWAELTQNSHFFLFFFSGKWVSVPRKD